MNPSSDTLSDTLPGTIVIESAFPTPPSANGQIPDTRKIYIILSQSGSNLSRFLKLVTREPYNHASIALDGDLRTMYSFGRLRAYNPFRGGFVRESTAYGTFKRFKNTRARVLEIEVSSTAYDAVVAIIHEMLDDQRRYHYNYWGLILAAIRIPFKKRYCYYCSEFVKYLALCMELPEAEKLPAIVKPMHLMSIPHTTVYEGILREYAPHIALSPTQA